MRRRSTPKTLLACAALVAIGACDPDSPDSLASPTEPTQAEAAANTPEAESAEAQAEPVAQPPAASPPGAAPSTPQRAEEAGDGPTAQAGSSRAGAADTAPPSGDCGLAVTRLVLASEIVDREPVELTQPTVSDTPVLAFAELDNRAGPDTSVEFVWTHEASGHEHRASLEVGTSPSWRTWARHRLIRGGPGAWAVRLQTEGGCVAGRLEFVAQ